MPESCKKIGYRDRRTPHRWARTGGTGDLLDTPPLRGECIDQGIPFKEPEDRVPGDRCQKSRNDRIGFKVPGIEDLSREDRSSQGRLEYCPYPGPNPCREGNSSFTGTEAEYIQGSPGPPRSGKPALPFPHSPRSRW